MNIQNRLFACGSWQVCICLVAANAMAAVHESPPQELSILRGWRGEYPVSRLDRRPEEPMTDALSVDMHMYFNFENGKLDSYKAEREEEDESN